MLLGERHRLHDVSVVVGELAAHEDRPVIVASFSELVARP
jgi:hypothetical protein